MQQFMPVMFSTSKVKMYFLGLLVWLGGVLLAHIAWRLCFVQTQAIVVRAETYEKKYRNITHKNILIAYSYVFNEKKI